MSIFATSTPRITTPVRSDSTKRAPVRSAPLIVAPFSSPEPPNVVMPAG